MKKKAILGLITSAAILTSSTAAVTAQPSEVVTALLSPQFTIVVDGYERDFYNAEGYEVHPIVYNGTTYLPLRAIGELMDKNVNWDQSTYTITLSGNRDDSTVTGVRDTSAVEEEISVEVRYDFTIVVDGDTQSFTDANGDAVYPILYNGSTYLPVRAIGELMGKSVSWDSNTLTVYIGGSYLNGSLVTDADSFYSGTVTDADSFYSVPTATPAPTATAAPNNNWAAVPDIQPMPPIDQPQNMRDNRQTMPDDKQMQPDDRQQQDYRGNEQQDRPDGNRQDNTNTDQTASITLAEAKTIALNNAGLSESGVTFTKAKLDKDDGTLVYDIEFYDSSYEYDYEINAETGAVISSERETRKSAASGTSASGAAASGTTTASITVETAKQTALNHAGLSSGDVTFTKAKLDVEDGTLVYDIEFRYGTTEYEYEINASTGGIESYDVDND